ncbi:hypothetical protein [Hwanghaeella sp.]|uniref:hypothetical protein n=1 Tax=Hwanghaeella sp. TaxID=2605943 RepID=UPI003CCC45F2
MVNSRTTRIPVFITHAWRFHDDWNRLVRMMEQVPNSPWVNYSVPWYDPAIRVHSEAGKEKLASMLLAQILPAKFVIFLCGPYSAKSAHVWFDMALDIAEERKKEVLLLPGFMNQDYLAPERIADARRISWDIEKTHAEITEKHAL